MKLIELDRKAKDLQFRYKSIQVINKAKCIKPEVSFRNNRDETKLYKKYLFYIGLRNAIKKSGD